ncbi:MAG: PAN domain-containing protein [Alphaproteobacteria bacterium]
MSYRALRRAGAFVACALASLSLSFGLAHAQGAPQSTWEPGQQLMTAEGLVSAMTWNVLDSAEQCRDYCFATPECTVWQWRTPQESSAPRSCFLNKGNTIQRRSAPANLVISGVVSRTAATPAQRPAHGLFPQPKPGLRILYSIDRPELRRWAEYRVLGNEGHATLVARRAWEGEVTGRDQARPDNARMIFDEISGANCTVTASAAALRTIAAGATLNYERRCAQTSSSGRSQTIVQVMRTVKGRETLWIGQGSFVGVVVEKKTRAVTRTYHSRSRPDLWSEQVIERMDTALWVESCGCFLKRTIQTRILSTRNAPGYLAAREREGETGLDEAIRLRRLEQTTFHEPSIQSWTAIEFY